MVRGAPHVRSLRHGRGQSPNLGSRSSDKVTELISTSSNSHWEKVWYTCGSGQ
ncbi:hypothetical protein RSAG8_08339, partial [Rhizoctonia solani AG-8 WAC10335]